LAIAILGIDVRTLAVFRMGLALVVIGDLLDRARQLKLLYTDFGVLPRAIALAYFSADSFLSLHMMSGLFWVQASLFVLAGLVALALFIGVHTRFMTCASWALLVSLQTRNWTVLHGGDALLRLLLFWSMFLPLGAAFSVDAARAPRPLENDAEHERVFSVASVALLLQVCFPYWFATLLRTNPTWWRGEALYYALSLDSLATPVGHALVSYPGVLRFSTYATMALEIGGTLAVFSPFGTRAIRTLLVPAFFALHAGIALTLQIGIFPYVSIVSWLAFVPGELIQSLLGRVPGIRASVERAWAFATRHVAALRAVGPATSRVPSLANQLTAAFFLAYVTIWNLCWLPYLDLGRHFPRSLVFVGQMLQLEQHWNLFAPAPLIRDGWFVVPGELADGTTVDLFRGGRAGSWDKPERVAALWPNTRWWMFTMRLVEFEGARLAYSHYLCNAWNERYTGPKHLNGLRIFYLYQDNLPEHRKGVQQKLLLYTAPCSGGGDPRPAAE
jgi:hypothetical protein